MRKLLLALGFMCSMQVFAMPTIAVPDLKVELKQEVDDPAVTKTVVSTLPKFTADIRGALVTSGQFKVVDVKSIKESQDSADEMNTDEVSKIFSDALLQSKKLNKCSSYVLVNMNSLPETADLSKGMGTLLSTTPEFENKYINQTGESGSSIKAECQIQVSVENKNKKINGTSNSSYIATIRLTKASSILWQQISKAGGSAEYYLLGEINYVGENEDSHSLKQTDNLTKQYVLEVSAEFKLVRASDKVVMAAFTANGRANDVKIVSTTNIGHNKWHHDIGRVVNQAAKDLASDVLQQMQAQFKFTQDTEEKERKAKEPIVVTDVKVYN